MMENRIPSLKDLEDKPIVPRLPVGWKVLSPDKVTSPRGNTFSIKLDNTGNIQSYSSDKVTPSFSFTQPTGGLKPIKPSTNQQFTTDAQTSLTPQFTQPKTQTTTTQQVVKQPTTTPSFSQWAVGKGFNATEYTQDLLKRGVSRDQVTDMVMKTVSDLKASYEAEFNIGRTFGTIPGQITTASMNPKQIPEVTRKIAEQGIAAADVGVQSIQYIPAQIRSSVLQAQGSQGASVVIKDKYISQAKQDIEIFKNQMLEKYPNSSWAKEIANLPENIGFSVASMGAGLIAAPLALIPGWGATAAWILGTVNSGAMAYQMASYSIMQAYLEAKDAEKRELTGQGLTQEEENQFKADFNAKAVEYSLWEAVPEALSNLAFGQLLFGKLRGAFPDSTLTRMVGTLTSMYGEELLTETITQMGQSAIEAETGLREGKLTWGEAFKEIAPQTFILTTVLGGIGNVSVQTYSRIKQSLATEVGTDSQLYKDFDKEIAKLMESMTGQQAVYQTSKDVLQAGALTQGTKNFEQRNAPQGEQPLSPNEQPKANITPEVKETYNIDDVIKAKSKEVESAKNPLDKSFLNQELTDLKKSKKMGITTVPKEYFLNKRTGEYIIPSDLQQPAVEPTMPPSTSVQTGLEGFGKEEAQTEMFGEVSGKESRKTPLTEVPQRQEVLPEQRIMELEGRQYELQSDPIAQIKVQVGNRAYGLDSLIDRKEGTFAYNDSFTVSQAKAIKPNVVFSESQKLKNGRIRADAVLDELADRYTNGNVSELINRVNEIRKTKQDLQEARQAVPEPLPEVTESTTKPVSEEVSTITPETPIEQPRYTIKRVNELTDFFGNYLQDPSVENAWELTKEFRTADRAKRAENLKARITQLIANEGMTSEQAIKQATKDTLSGELPLLDTTYFEELTEDIRKALFDKVYYELRNEPYEMVSTVTALTNALAGKPIPRDPGIKGGSAYSRLQRVFGDNPKLLEGITKNASKKKPLDKIVEGMFREIPEGGLNPIPIDEQTFEWLRSLSSKEAWQPTFGMDMPEEGKNLFIFNPTGKLGLEQQQQQFELGQEPYTTSDIKIEDKRTRAERLLDYAKLREPSEPVFYNAPELTRAVKQDPLMKDILTPRRYQALKAIGMGTLDILNGIRSIKASVDQSFALRQLFWIMPDIKQDMIDVMITSWKAGWSETAAKEAWTEITKKQWYPLHEKMVEKGHVDAFRRGGIEEFGFVGESERPISKAFAKLPTTQWSERNYVAGINAGIAFAYDRYYESIMRDSQLIAEGKKKAPKEGFSIERDFGAMMDATADLTGRAKLGDLKPNSATYQAINALFFSIRNKLGRFLTPVHLLGFNKVGKGAYFNPRLLKNTWKNVAVMVGAIGSIIALGELAGWWDVEKDPNSADFGKIRIGKMRIDPWAGMQQVFVFFYRMASGKIKSTTTGETGQIDPADLISDTVEKSGSPALSLLLESRRGKTYSGEKVSATDVGQWVDRLAPFLVSDIYNTLEEYPGDIGKAVTSGALGYLGAGINTYGTETQTQQFTDKLGTQDTESMQEEIDRLTKAGATQAKINEVKAKIYDTSSLRQDLDKIINTFDEEALDKDQLARYFKDWNTQNDSYKVMSSKEKEQYIENNPDFQTGKIFWGELTTISTLDQALALVELANDYDIAPDMIPAFQLTDKGKERIPVNQDLWEGYFEYYDLPGSSYFAIEDEEVIQEYIDNGKLDAGMLKIWQQYQKSSENARKVYRKKYKLTMAKGDWRDDYRRANPELDAWLIENKELSPLAKKSTSYSSSKSISPVKTSTPSMPSISRPVTKKSYPKFKKPRLSMSINAPRVSGV